MSQAQVTITRRGAERVRGGHLWVYRSDVRGDGGAEGGAAVAVRDERGRFVGRALYSDRSEIALRLLTARDEAIDREWWRARLRSAASRRAGLEREADAFRLVYSEGDLLPSIIVDRYADVLVLQTLSQGAESLKTTLVELLVEEFAPRSIVERNDVRVRALEGLPAQSGVLYGEEPGELEVAQHGVGFRVAPLRGGENRAVLEPEGESLGRTRLRARTRARLLHLQRRFCAKHRAGVRERLGSRHLGRRGRGR